MSNWIELSSWQAPLLDDEELKGLASKRCPSCGREFEGFFVQCPSDQLMLQDVPSPKGTLAKRYECGRKIGSGSLFDVYEGTDNTGEQAVVVKVLKADFECEQPAMKRFEQEQMIASALKHQNIAPPLAFGALPEQYTLRPFVVEERVNGIQLSRALAEWGACDKQISFRIMSQICDVFEHAHQLGAVHGDFKPSNVFLWSDNKEASIKVVDFAVTRKQFPSKDAGRHSASASTQSINSAAYCAPEVARGSAQNALSDIYSIGCVFYELMSGHPPFQGQSAIELAFQHDRDEVPPLEDSHGASALRQAVMKCLVKEPAARLSNIGDLKAALAVLA